MSRNIKHKDIEVNNLVNILSKADENSQLDPAGYTKSRKILDAYLNSALSVIVTPISETERSISPLSISSMGKMKTPDFYALVYHGVNYELKENPTQMSYILMSAIISYVEENPGSDKFLLNTRLSPTEITDVVFSTEFDTTIAILAVSKMLKELVADNHEVQEEKSPLPIEPIAIDIYDLTPENTVNNNAN
jgi:hypothetical protein